MGHNGRRPCPAHRRPGHSIGRPRQPVLESSLGRGCLHAALAPRSDRASVWASVEGRHRLRGRAGEPGPLGLRTITVRKRKRRAGAPGKERTRALEGQPSARRITWPGAGAPEPEPEPEPGPELEPEPGPELEPDQPSGREQGPDPSTRPGQPSHPCPSGPGRGF